MSANVGGIDRILRIVVGVLLLAWAIFGVPATSFNWVGWIGVVPLLTGVFNFCPAYTILGISTCPMKN